MRALPASAHVPRSEIPRRRKSSDFLRKRERQRARLAGSVDRERATREPHRAGRVQLGAEADREDVAPGTEAARREPYEASHVAFEAARLDEDACPEATVEAMDAAVEQRILLGAGDKAPRVGSA